jgi:hypothetical protein
MRRSVHILGFLALALLAAQAIGAATGPRLVLDDPVFDFGTIYQGDPVTHAFRLRNAGDALLKLQAVRDSCGCTTSSASAQEIAPGATGEVTVALHTALLRDQVLKHVYVDTDDRATPRATLTLEGFVKREVDILPAGVYLGSVPVGQSAAREVEIRPLEVKSFRILRVASDKEAIQVSDPQPIADQRGGYRLTITLQAQPEPVRLITIVKIRTTLPHARELEIPVYGRVFAPASRPQGPPPGPPAPKSP